MRAAIAMLLFCGCNADVRFVSARDPDCRIDGDCHLSSLHCDTAVNKCVPCLVDAHCGLGFPRCVAQRCVECNVNTDCSGEEICEPTSHRCGHRCEPIEGCEEKTPVCDTKTNVCKCTATSCREGDRVCDPVSGQCLQCIGNANCGGETPYCNVASGLCVRCLSSADCPEQAPYCEPRSGECVAR